MRLKIDLDEEEVAEVDACAFVVSLPPRSMSWSIDMLDRWTVV